MSNQTSLFPSNSFVLSLIPSCFSYFRPAASCSLPEGLGGGRAKKPSLSSSPSSMFFFSFSVSLSLSPAIRSSAKRRAKKWLLNREFSSSPPRQRTKKVNRGEAKKQNKKNKPISPLMSRF